MAGPIPEVTGAAIRSAIRRAEDAWRTVAPDDAAGRALLDHGGRVWTIVAEAGGDLLVGIGRTVAAAAVLHEVGRFVDDRGHHAARGARWAAVHADEILDGASGPERRLLGELILFHRHRGELPPELSRAEVVDLFRRAEECDRTAGRLPRGIPATALAAAAAERPRGPLGAVLRASDRRERIRHPWIAGRVSRIRRPDR